MGEVDSGVRAVKKLVQASTVRVQPFITPGRVSVVQVSANYNGPVFDEYMGLRGAEGLNFPQVAGAEKLISPKIVADGVWKDMRAI